MCFISCINLLTLAAVLCYPYNMTDKQKVIVFVASFCLTFVSVLIHNSVKKELFEARLRLDGRE